MRITKRELLKMIHWDPLKHEYPNMGRWGITIMERTARALGYEVVEELELPKRVGTEVGSSAWQIGRVGGPALGAQYPLNPQEEALLRELALRYNAKAAVLKIADGLEARAPEPAWLLNAAGHKSVAAELRAVYEEKP